MKQSRLTDSFTLTSSYSLLLSACRIIDLDRGITEIINEICQTHHTCLCCALTVEGVGTFCLKGRLSGNSSACPHTPQPWQSCCPGLAPCPLPPLHVADTWGSLPGWRSRVCPRLWSPGLSYWRTEQRGWEERMTWQENKCCNDSKLANSLKVNQTEKQAVFYHRLYRTPLWSGFTKHYYCQRWLMWTLLNTIIS